MPQNACVVIQQLNKDIPPETAQPLAILEHGNGAVGSLIRRPNARTSTSVMVATRHTVIRQARPVFD